MGGSPSTIQFATSTVVAVQSVAAYGAAYPATTTQAYYLHEQVVRIRSVVSDPFGSADVGGAEISITDPNGATVIATTPMTEVADSGVDTRTYEYAFQVPMQAEIGTWTASITAHEGTEGTVTHTGNTGFDVRGKIEFDHAWVNANAGDAVTLAISGGVDAVAGSSTAPSTPRRTWRATSSNGCRSPVKRCQIWTKRAWAVVSTSTPWTTLAKR